MAEYDLKPISEIDKEMLSNFTCSVPIENNFVEDFLKGNAIDFHEHNIAKTQVLMDGEKTVGYFTLFLDYFGIGKRRLKQQGWDEDFMNNKFKFPAVRLHSLGVDDEYRKQGIGKILLETSLDTCIEISEKAGCAFVNIEAFKHAESFYLKNRFKRLHSKHDTLKVMAIRIRDLKESAY